MGHDAEDLEFLESLKQDFIEECLESLQKCEECLLSFEKNKSDEVLREYLRVLHSIKGSSRAVEFDKIAKAVHQIESLGQKTNEPQFVELSLSLVDDLRDAVELIRQNQMDEMEAKLDATIAKAVI